jgi:ferredoxin-NADP reductase
MQKKQEGRLAQMSHKVRMVERREYAGGILTVTFTKPEGYTHKPGQWCFLELPDLGVADEGGLRRHLSITAAPGEDTIGFATKISDSAFKQTLTKLEVGSEILIEEAKGRLALPKDRDTPICFLAGGIGITPFRSMAMDNFLTGGGHETTLLYSSRTPEETPYFEEFQKLTEEDDKFRFVATMTRMQQSKMSWDGREGRMDAKMIAEEFPRWREGAFYLAGPPNMVATILDLLKELGVPSENVTVEKFISA